MKKIFYILFLTSLLSGCASTYRQNGLDATESSKIAVIESPPCESFQCILIQEVDGKWRGIGWIQRYELIPGKRTLKISFNSPGVRSATALLVEFSAAAGHTYTVRTNQNYSTMKWEPQIIDKNTKEVASKIIGSSIAY
jgi:hypothetical protein